MQQRSGIFIDCMNLVLAVLLIASPWILRFPTDAAISNALIFGVVIGSLAIAALTAFAKWEEWVNLVAGLWVLVAPFVLHFFDNAEATLTHVIIGGAVAFLAAIELWMLGGYRPPHEPAHEL